MPTFFWYLDRRPPPTRRIPTYPPALQKKIFWAKTLKEKTKVIAIGYKILFMGVTFKTFLSHPLKTLQITNNIIYSQYIDVNKVTEYLIGNRR
jgi:hypothetical protein